jgi:hypothetical protein
MTDTGRVVLDAKAWAGRLCRRPARGQMETLLWGVITRAMEEAGDGKLRVTGMEHLWGEGYCSVDNYPPARLARGDRREGLTC